MKIGYELFKAINKNTPTNLDRINVPSFINFNVAMQEIRYAQKQMVLNQQL